MIKILYTPTEILERNPSIAAKWTASDVGYLFKLQLVRGKKTSRYTLLDEDDVLRFFMFAFPKNDTPSPF